MKTNKRTIKRDGKVALLVLERDGNSLFAVSYPHVVGKDENGVPVEMKQRMTQQFMLEVEAVRFFDRMADFYRKQKGSDVSR